MEEVKSLDDSEIIPKYSKPKIIENISDIISIVIDEEHFKANIMLKHEIDFSSINKDEDFDLSINNLAESKKIIFDFLFLNIVSIQQYCW